MEFLKFIRLDVISALILVFILIRSGLKNQKRVWRNLVCLIFATAIIMVPLYFDVGGIFGVAFSFLNTNVWPVIGNALHITKTTEFISLMNVVVIFLAIGLIELILVGICAMIGGSDRRKYKKYPSYATIHRPLSGIIAGIFRAAIVIYLLFIIWGFIFDFIGVTPVDYVSDLLKTFDPIVDVVKNLVKTGIGG